MSLISSRLHNFILPFGFAMIIILMIITTILTSHRIEKTTNTIIDNELQTSSINRSLDIMSDATLQRSHIFLKMMNTKNPLLINKYIVELESEGIKFKSERKKLTAYSLSDKEKELLKNQDLFTKKNEAISVEIINHLRLFDFDIAAFVINTEALVNNKKILNIIGFLHKEAYQSAQFKSKQSKIISADTYRSIIGFNLISILLTLLLMCYLNRKQRKNDKDLSILASTDSLTKLPNRFSFIKSIEKTILHESNSCFAIIFFDIDYFKSINDNYGHEIGDEIIKLFSQTISDKISSKDILSRFGGDEFVLLLKNIRFKSDAVKFINSLSDALDTSFHINGYEVFVSASIGASTYPHDGVNPKELLKNADIAMYAAKEAGRNCHQFFSLENSKKLHREHQLSHALQTILKSNNKEKELFLTYQPLVDIKEKQFYECEALIRWETNDQKIDTAEFIEIAEKSNLIEKINLFVIEEACKQQLEWKQQGLEDIRININLSGNKRIFNQLFKRLSENIEKYDLNPKSFGIELTERTIYEISNETINSLSHFREQGIKIAIDDFGTGYSSLSYLKDLPITSVKIDGSFIFGLPDEKTDVALVKAIITLAHSLGFDVIAEGVETQSQLDFLENCHCNTVQGHLLHKSLSPEQIVKLKLA